MSTDEERLRKITETVIGFAFEVANTLGHGFMEKCYGNALVRDLREAGLRVAQQVPLNVWYKDTVVGEYIADLVIEDVLVVELKAVERLDPIHSAQCINYLAATRLPLCLLINFAKRVEVRRIAGAALNQNASVSICAPSVAKQ